MVLFIAGLLAMLLVGSGVLGLVVYWVKKEIGL